MSSEESSSYIVYMDGLGRIDVAKPDGANLLIQDGHVGIIISTANQMRSAISSQRTSPRLRRAAEADLKRLYVLLYHLAFFGSFAALREYVPLIELQALLQHAKEVFQSLVGNRRWKQTGVLKDYDQELMECLLAFLRHEHFFKQAKENNMFVDLAKLSGACTGEGRMPSQLFTDAFLKIVMNIQVSVSYNYSTWEESDTFKFLEQTGMLGQFFRCVTRPSSNPEDSPRYLELLDSLTECLSLIKKKLKAGTVTGEILRNVVMGKDGVVPVCNRSPAVQARLVNLLQLTSVICPDDEDSYELRLCSNCGSEDNQERLSICSRCKNAYYCSKECQVADWNKHKQFCKPRDKKQEQASQMASEAFGQLIDHHYVLVAQRMMDVIEETGVEIKDLILEIDYMVDPSTGMAPGLEDPPKFKIAPRALYLEGERPNEPDWFYKGSDEYDRNIQILLSAVQDFDSACHTGPATGDDLMTLVRFPSGGIRLFQMGSTLLSRQHLDLYWRFYHGEADNDELKAMFPDSIAASISMQTWLRQQFSMI